MTGVEVLRRVLEDHAETIEWARRQVELSDQGSYYVTRDERAVVALADALTQVTGETPQ